MRRPTSLVLTVLVLAAAARADGALILEDIRANRTSLLIGNDPPVEDLFGVVDGPPLFDHRLLSVLERDPIRLTGDARQHSIVGGTLLEGTVFATAFGSGGGAAWTAEAESATQVAFRLEKATRFALRATIIASDAADALAYAEASILAPDGTRLHGAVREEDGVTEVEVDDLLAPGDYVLFIDALVIASSAAPAERPVADISFSLALPGPAVMGAIGLAGLVGRGGRRRYNP
jgi:hypothetical protein